MKALSTLTKVQNSLFVPDLGNWINRKPTYVLSEPDWQPPIRPASSTDAHARPPEPQAPDEAEPLADERPSMQRSDTITSRLTDSHWAALPPGRTLEG